jgi:hypothetical protein
MQFAGIVSALPGIYWQKISTVLRQLVAAGLVEQLESRTATLNGVKYPHYTFRYRILARITANHDPTKQASTSQILSHHTMENGGRNPANEKRA